MKLFVLNMPYLDDLLVYTRDRVTSVYAQDAHVKRKPATLEPGDQLVATIGAIAWEYKGMTHEKKR